MAFVPNVIRATATAAIRTTKEIADVSLGHIAQSPSLALKAKRELNERRLRTQRQIAQHTIHNYHVDQLLHEKLSKGLTLSIRDHIFRFVNAPTSSHGAALFMGFFLILSCIDYIIYLEQTTREDVEHTHTAIIVIWIAFMFEFALRVISYQPFCGKRMLHDGLLWVDFLCLIPRCLRMVVGNQDHQLFVLAEALIPLRMLRLTRLFHSSRILMTSIENSLQACG